MRKLIKNNDGSVVPVLLFILTIIGCGALYTLFFTEIAIPSLSYLIPDSDSKTFNMMMIYLIPLIILIVGVFALMKEGLKRGIGGYY
jgi:hypothetical protein